MFRNFFYEVGHAAWSFTWVAQEQSLGEGQLLQVRSAWLMRQEFPRRVLLGQLVWQVAQQKELALATARA